jgi:hypothetical protein
MLIGRTYMYRSVLPSFCKLNKGRGKYASAVGARHTVRDRKVHYFAFACPEYIYIYIKMSIIKLCILRSKKA